jgi:hypothetical protein
MDTAFFELAINVTADDFSNGYASRLRCAVANSTSVDGFPTSISDTAITSVELEDGTVVNVTADDPVNAAVDCRAVGGQRLLRSGGRALGLLSRLLGRIVRVVTSVVKRVVALVVAVAKMVAQFVMAVVVSVASFLGIDLTRDLLFRFPSPRANGLVGAGVYAVCQYQWEAILGGEFTGTADGELAVNNIVRFDGKRFFALGDGLDGPVYALAVYSEDLYAAGGFRTLGNGDLANGIARWNGLRWNSLPVGNGNGVGVQWIAPFSRVNALLVWNDRLIIAGNFSRLGDNVTNASSIVAYEAFVGFTTMTGRISHQLTRTANGVSGNVKTLAVHSEASDAADKGALWVGGCFEHLAPGVQSDAQTRVNSLVRFVPHEGATPSTLFGGLGNWTRVFVGERTGVVSRDAFNAGIRGRFDTQPQCVNAMASYGGSMFVGGDFRNYANTSIARRMLRMTPTGAWFPDTLFPDTVHSMFAMPDGKLLVGGDFAESSRLIVSSDITFNRAAAIEQRGSGFTVQPLMTTATQPATNGFARGGVRAFGLVKPFLAGESKQTVYVGGTFSVFGNDTTRASDRSANRVAQHNPAAGTFDILNLPKGAPGVAGSVFAVFPFDKGMLVGGNFSHLRDGTLVNNVAYWNNETNTWRSLPNNNREFVGVNGVVRAFAFFNGSVIIAGDFLALSDGMRVQHLARLDWETSVWDTLQRNMSALSPTYGPRNGVTGRWCRQTVPQWTTWAVQPSRVDFPLDAPGYRFNNVQQTGIVVQRFQRNGNTNTVVPYDDPTAEFGTICLYGVNALAVYRNELVIGGYFTHVHDKYGSTVGVPVSNGVSTHFVMINGIVASGVVRFDGDRFFTLGGGNFVPPDRPQTTLKVEGLYGGAVKALLVHKDRLIIGGWFFRVSTDVFYMCNSAWCPNARCPDLTGAQLVSCENATLAANAVVAWTHAGFEMLGVGDERGGNGVVQSWSHLWGAAEVNALAEYKGEVVIAGAFNRLGWRDGPKARGIAIYNSDTNTMRSFATCGTSDGVSWQTYQLEFNSAMNLTMPDGIPSRRESEAFGGDPHLGVIRALVSGKDAKGKDVL